MLHRKLYRKIYKNPQTLNRQIVKKYAKKFCKYYSDSLIRKKQGECLICYNTDTKFVSIPCCCEQLICYSCFEELLDRNLFKCMICREHVDFEEEIFKTTFFYIKNKPNLRRKLLRKREKKVNNYFYKKRWKIERLIVLSEIFANIKNTDFELSEILKIRFINTFTVKTFFKDGQVIIFTLSKKDSEL